MDRGEPDIQQRWDGILSVEFDVCSIGHSREGLDLKADLSCL
jgi:hypothetical protein